MALLSCNWLCLVIFLGIIFMKDGTCSNFSFNQDNTLVLLNPYVSTRVNNPGYEDSELDKMISTMSSSFSKIVTLDLSTPTRYSLAEKIPLAVAKYSREHNKSLEVYISLLHNQENGQNYGDSSLLKLAVDLANQANFVRNGTVGNIFFSFGNAISLNDLDGILPSYSKMLKNYTNAYKLGARLPLTLCNSIGNTLWVKSLNFVIFFRYASSENYKVGAEKTVSQFIDEFEKCKKVIYSLPINLQVYFSTSWSDTDQFGTYNYSALVYFWERMSIWSGESETKVLMVQAFDAPRAGLVVREGWWRLVDTDGDEIIFEDKRSAALEETKRQAKTKDGPLNLKLAGNSETSEKQNSLTTTILSIIFSFLIAVVVFGAAAMLAYKRLMTAIKKPIVLTNKEIHDFYNGEEEGSDKAGQFPWNKAAYGLQYELKRCSFELSEGAILGVGTFGMVCKGRVKQEGEEWIEVAVKKAKDGCPSTALKGLLSEIKVLSHLGRYEYIVSLIGANTEEIVDGKVLLFTELCCGGSLEKYLREKKVKNCESEAESQFSKWCLEIARGMEFISSKKVVHADLATRNILLTEGLSAKITDFGLSRRLYNYQSYMKSETEPLPWRWMSPESLRKLEFNEKTDVWAFGVTLWEIYSFGNVPYGGLVWNSQFANTLCEGLRLQKPDNCEDWIYEKIMAKCWEVEAVQRPSFKNLVEEFSNLRYLIL